MKKIYLAVIDPTIKQAYRLIEHNIKEVSDFKTIKASEIPEEILNGKKKIYCTGKDYVGLLNPGIKTTKDITKAKYMITPPKDLKHSFDNCIYTNYDRYAEKYSEDINFRKMYDKKIYLPEEYGKFPAYPISGLTWNDIKKLFDKSYPIIWSSIFGVDSSIPSDTIMIKASDVMFGQNNWKCDDVIEFSEFYQQNNEIGNRMLANLDVNHMSQFEADILVMVIGGTSNIWLDNELINKCSPVVRDLYSTSIGIARQDVDINDEFIKSIVKGSWMSNPVNQTVRGGMYVDKRSVYDIESILPEKYRMIVDKTDYSEVDKSRLLGVLYDHIKRLIYNPVC